jgi:large subunit ribosomal protein L25
MSKVSPIKAEPRNEVGTHATKKCRKNGMLPGIVYGHKQESLAVAVPEVEFLRLFNKGIHLFELEMADKKENVLIKDIQYNYLGTDPIHVDFTRVDLSELVKVQVPLIIRGIPAGVQAGGVMQQSLRDIEVECLVTDIPEEIRVNVADLQLDQTLHASDIKLPEGAKLVTEPDAAIVSVALLAEEAEAVAPEGEVAAGTEPKVITRGKEKEEGAEKA